MWQNISFSFKICCYISRQIQERHRKIAVATFSLLSEPVSMTIRSPDKKQKSIQLLVLSEEGELHFFSHKLNGYQKQCLAVWDTYHVLEIIEFLPTLLFRQIKKPLKAQKSIKVVDASAAPLRIVASSFCYETDDILIAYGTTLRVVFEHVVCVWTTY